MIAATISTSAYAADTITGTFFEAQQKKIDAQTCKITDKERQLQQQKSNFTGQNKLEENQNSNKLLLKKRNNKYNLKKTLLTRKKKSLRAFLQLNNFKKN